jgi:rhomboid family GlyGly-CTERM serine protease
MPRLPGAWLLALPALLFQLPGWAGHLQLDFAELGRGELWRWVTCHWTHWSLDHLVWDLGAFLLLAALCERHGGRRAPLAAVASAALLIPAVLWISMPAMGSYRGLSGIDSALFVLAAVLVFREESGQRRLLATLAIAGFLAKAVYESATGAALFAESAGSFVPAPLAHLTGGVCGLFAGAAYNLPQLRKGGFDAQEARADG